MIKLNSNIINISLLKCCIDEIDYDKWEYNNYRELKEE